MKTGKNESFTPISAAGGCCNSSVLCLIEVSSQCRSHPDIDDVSMRASSSVRRVEGS